MNLPTSALGLLMVALAAVAATADDKAQADKQVEFRLAEEAMGDGLAPFKIAGTGREIFLYPDQVLSPNDIASVCFEKNARGRTFISVNMTDVGAEKLAKVSKNNVGKHLAVVLNGRVIVAPRIMSEMKRSAQLDGRFSNDELHTILDALLSMHNTGTKLDVLLVELRDTLLARVKALEEKHRAGKASIGMVISARTDLLDSELELVSSKEAHIDVFEKRLENLRQLEEVMKKRIAAGQAGLADMLLTKAERLRAEIDLLREQARKN